MGYGANSPVNPHHRASHNSQNNNISSPSDNEVATDYNAGFTGALAGLIELANSSN